MFFSTKIIFLYIKYNIININNKIHNILSKSDIIIIKIYYFFVINIVPIIINTKPIQFLNVISALKK
jgi:hypothetical protein